MADDRVVIVDGVSHHFPSDASDEEVSAVLNAGTQPAVSQIDDASNALPMFFAGKAAQAGGRIVKAMSDAASRVRVNPSVALEEFSITQPQKVLKAVSMAAKNPLRPDSAATTIAKRAAPYSQTLSTLSAVQAGLELAKMAPGESQRRDVGFLGIGGSMPEIDVLTAAVKKGANPTQAAAEIAKGDPRKFAELITAYSKSLGQGQ